MKKLLLLLLVILFSSFVLASDIAYVVKNPSNPDSNFINVLNDSGLTYDLIDDSQVAGTNFANYRMILLGNEKINNVPVNNYKSLFANPDYYDGWSAYKGSVTSSQPLRANNIAGNSITEGLEGIFQVYTQAKDNSGLSLPMYYLYGKKYSVQKITTTTDSLSKYIVATKENPRRVFFGITKSDYWTQESKELFKNSIMWVLNGEDRDGDGFFGDVDCNDNDAEINPDAEEIPYDSLDNNCSDGDLADVDNDGYCLAGYYIQNSLQCFNDLIIGSDCDDLDESIHPNVFDPVNDVDENCVNDVPIYERFIPDEVWNEDTESENVYNLDDYFSDRDGDVLEYGVEGNVKIDVLIDGSLVSLMPEENWHGSEHVRFIASDGSLNIKSDDVVFVVLNVNDAPEFLEMDDIKVVAGELVKIIPNVTDADNDILQYSFSQHFDSNGEWQTEIEDAGIYEINIHANDMHGGVADKEILIEVLPKLAINEFVSDSDNEWIEIYNPYNFPVNLDDFTLEDGTGNIDELEGEVSALGFFVFYPNFVLNNDGDIIILKQEELETDKVAYGNWNDGNEEDNALTPDTGKSAGRNPDGKDSNIDKEDFSIFEYPSKELPNLADMIPPVISLLNPDDESFFNVDYVNFNYTASDNSANKLNCSFYSDVKGTFEKLAEQAINNGANGNFYAVDIDDGSYVWQIECSDSINIGESETRTFTIDEPDAPIVQDIPNITIEETEQVTIEVNASDADEDVLGYSINDTRFIQDEEEENIFSWQTNYNDSGEYNFEVSVSDGTVEVTKQVKVTVTNNNRKPIFTGNIENQNWDEDTSLELDLSVFFSDDDNDDLEYSLQGNNHIQISVINGVATLTPDENWNGFEEVYFVASDSEEEVKSNLVHLIVNPVNDGPFILSYSPSDLSLKILANTNQDFNVVVNDVDDEVNVSWFVDDDIASGEGLNYLFNKDIGDYEVKAKASDGILEDEKTWNVLVRGSEDFACGDLGGNLCSDKERCTGNIIETSDINSCCSVKCIPNFEDSEMCDIKDNNIEINIKNPDENDEFKVGEAIKAEIRVENNFEEEKDFDLSAVFYDFTENEEIENSDENVDLDADESKEIEFELKIPEDADEDNDFYVFVKVYDEDNESLCNEKYVKIKVEREEEDVTIEDFTITPENSFCGDWINVDLDIKNMGSEEQDVYVTIENAELGIKEESEMFELEEFGKKDEATKTFSIKIPEDAEKGEYDIKATAFFNGLKNSAVKNLILGDCVKEEVEIRELEKVSLNSLKEKVTKKIDKSKGMLLLLLSLFSGIVFVSVLIWAAVRRGKRQ